MKTNRPEIFSQRSSGILLPVSSIGDGYGCGDLGPAAYRFIDFLAQAGMRWWQVLPNVPPGYGDSPYQALSAFAGNRMYVSLDLLHQQGLLRKNELPTEKFSVSSVDYAKAMSSHDVALFQAFSRFKAKKRKFASGWNTFLNETEQWLDAYGLYMLYKEEEGLRSWLDWPKEKRRFQPRFIKQLNASRRNRYEFHRFTQWCFWSQWRILRAYAKRRGIRIMGDLPIYVALDSSDVWAHQDLFMLKPDGRPEAVAGVPPDDFSATGQLWGNPLYRWDRLKSNGYRWWRHRIEHSLRQYDALRLDHFIGFHRYWRVPGKARIAKNGRYEKGPGAHFFETLTNRLGTLPFVSEDLGNVTPEVFALRDAFGYPGMRVLQFGFGSKSGRSSHAPHNIPEHSVVYTGTHDNNTSVGWFADGGKKDIKSYLGGLPNAIHWAMIRLALATRAHTAIVPMQDILGLGAKARLNYPGRSGGNWKWRCPSKRLTPALADNIRKINLTYGR